MSKHPTIVYTKTDESPAMATASFLPIVRSFLQSSGIQIDVKDISLAARILAAFPEYLQENQKVEDALAWLGTYTQDPNANIVKLPNISASVPQLTAAIAELQSQGFALPDYPLNPQNDTEKQVKLRYDKIKGSAVNPVIRDGNSDRRAPAPVKRFAQKNPHYMGEWKSDCKSHVAHMTEGDFFGTEQSAVLESAQKASIELIGSNGETLVLKETVNFAAGEVADASFMSRQALCDFIHREIADAKAKGVLFSVHLKATMMKVSDPIIFGCFVEIFYQDVLQKYAKELTQVGFNPRNGIADLYTTIKGLDESTQQSILADMDRLYEKQPDLAMVNSDKGITNLHVPNNVIIDASMPAALRNSGCMWNAKGEKQETKFVIPDRSYAELYQEVVDFCKENGAFDVCTVGTVPNVGLMAQKAEEYGSHDKTFEIPFDGILRVKGAEGIIFEHHVEKGDIWRMCQVKDIAIKDWVKMAVSRAKEVGAAVFWLDSRRAHDAQLIEKVQDYLQEYDKGDAEILILDPNEAMKYTLTRFKAGLDTVSVTGNVLRDYLTDLFPILELGTSAKVLSIVPLIQGGALFETGAGGSAPILVQQLLSENHFIWDSLGEFLALQVSLEKVASTYNHSKAAVLAAALDEAVGQYLEQNKAPSPKVFELDTRGSHYFLTLFWAEALANQNVDAELKAEFTPIAQALNEQQSVILSELKDIQGQAVQLDGYYHASDAVCAEVMRPSVSFNQIIG